VNERPSRPRLRAIRGKRFGEPPRRPKKPDVFAQVAEASKPRPARTTKRPRKAKVIEPPGALLHLALEKDGHHREWFIGILGKEWGYTAIYDIDWMPHIFSPMSLAEAKAWVTQFQQLIAQSEAAGWQPARLRHCGWSGLKAPTESIVPTRSASSSGRRK